MILEGIGNMFFSTISFLIDKLPINVVQALAVPTIPKLLSWGA